MTFSITITRQKSAPAGTHDRDGTIGKLQTSADFSCDTLELEWRDNKRGESCIFADVYPAKLWFSPSLNRYVIRLEDRHGRKDCLIHNGNFAGQDAGEITQIHGCTEVGIGYGMIERKDKKLQFGILHSKNTLDRLVEHIIKAVGLNGEFDVTYVWAQGCEPDKEITGERKTQ